MNPLTQFKKIRILPLLIALALVARSADAYLAAISDFNGDGHPDYVLENGNTNQTAIWYLNNNVFVSDVYGPTLPTNWFVKGVADFNSDGHPDYLLYNFSTRQTAIWYLSGPTFISGAYGPTIPSGWDLRATADFNSDGHPDYVLENGGTGQTAIWYLNNNIYVSGGYGPTLPTTNWFVGAWRILIAMGIRIMCFTMAVRVRRPYGIYQDERLLEALMGRAFPVAGNGWVWPTLTATATRTICLRISVRVGQ